MIGCGKQRQERQLVRLGPSAVNAFVEDRQQIIEDRAVGVEQLVEKHKLGFGQHAGCHRDDLAFPQLSNVDGAEDLIRFGKTGQHVLKVTAVDAERELANERRLGCPRRAV